MSTIPLPGRTQELSHIGQLIDAVHDGGSALLVRGEAGIGKSAIVAEAASRAKERGFRVLSTTGVQSETELTFAGLHQLLRPLLGGLGALPIPQRNALGSAFGLVDAGIPELFLIGLASLNLLSETAAAAPLLLIADDAQWLDRPSCEVLAFVARRLASDPIVFLAAIRDGYDTPLDRAGVAELRLDALDYDVAAGLVDAQAPDLGSEQRAWLLDEAAGNPLALQELSSALASEQPANREAGSSLLRAARLEQVFANRIRDLPARTRSVLLVASADESGMLAEVLAAASVVAQSDVTFDTLHPAIAARLITIEGDELRFRHPLVRSSIYHASSAAQRRAAHAAVADALGDAPDRRAWHRAASIAEPLEEVAAELEAAAARAQHKGGLSVAIVALERAAQLTTDPTLRCGRLLQAAEAAFEEGQPNVALRLMNEAAKLPLSTRDRARFQWLDAMLVPNDTGNAARLSALVQSADVVLRDGEAQLARQLLSAAAFGCYWAEPGADARREVVEALEDLPNTGADDWLLEALAYAAPIARGGAVLARLASMTPSYTADPISTFHCGQAAAILSAFDISAKFLSVAIEKLRQEGRVALLTQALMSRAWDETYRGNWHLAWPAAEEARKLAEESAQPLWEAGAEVAQAIQAALRGEAETALALTAKAEPIATTARASLVLSVIQLARGLTSLASGHYQEAFDRFYRMFDARDPAYHITRCWAIGDIAEAAVRCEREETARRLMEEMQSIANATPLPWLHVGLAYARALLAHDRHAESLFRTALASDLLTSWPFYRGRLELAFGTWLRRQRRITESRPLLRAARDTFDTLGTLPWGERARNELRAAGETSGDRKPQARERLTPQELQIARMAAQGLSNREIGQQLFLSHRTVASHLHQIFPKLGIASRSQLGGVLPQ